MSRLGTTVRTRSETFQDIRSLCVALSQAAHALTGAYGKIQIVVDCLMDLRDVLKGSGNSTPFLDAKLADYTFFPISQVLKASQKVTIECLELCLDCTKILTLRGWRHELAAPLAAQLMILCTLLAQDQPKGFAFSNGTTELQIRAYGCLRAVSTVVGFEARTLLTAEAHFPQLGQTVSVVLDGVHDGKSHEVQTAAVETLYTLITNVLDRELCAGFLPGIVSKLSRVLTPTTKQRRNPAVLVKSLNILAFLIKTTLNNAGEGTQILTDAAIKDLRKTSAGSNLITGDWKQSTAVQLKAALTPIMRLVNHGRRDVKAGLAQLCLVILGVSRQTLQACISMAMETSITLFQDPDEAYTRTQLQALLRAHPPLIAHLQTVLHSWLDSLTTVLQSSDFQAKDALLERIYVAYDLLLDAGVDTSVIDGLLAQKLRDGITVTLQSPVEGQRQNLPIRAISSMEVAMLTSDRREVDFQQPLVTAPGQREVMHKVDKLITIVSMKHDSSIFTTNIARELATSQGAAQIANFWLLLSATKVALQQRDVVAHFVDVEGDDRSSAIDHLEQLYGYSVSVLGDADDETNDPRLYALALRTLALQAQVAGNDFRYELIDCLYPVLHILATPDDQLQRDSMTTLDIFTATCGYDSVQQLIVENVDYLINAVALKLNAFDVSPQAAQVLMMMVKLAGPSLLPHLEDTVDSIFNVLENYHGYPLLVEMLFKVLCALAEEGAQTTQLTIGSSDIQASRDILLDTWKAVTMKELQVRIYEKAKERAETQGQEMLKQDPHPQRPWGEMSQPGAEVGDDELLDTADGEAVVNTEDLDEGPPAPRTYALLLKIADLTQHFLPSASPSLRTSLLALIKISIPALARHENSFLPLINTLWPEIMARLDDQETHVQALSLDIVSLLCEYAGNFMRTRITSSWPRTIELYHDVTLSIIDMASTMRNEHADVAQNMQLEKAVAKMQHSPADYSNTSSRLLWNSLKGMLTSIVRNVSIEVEILDQATSMLAPFHEDETVRSALDQLNADALWLARIRAGRIKPRNMPTVPDTVCWRFAKI